jgi:hypothetical protein
VPTGVGSVVSVGLSMPSEFTVAGSPVNTNGTLAVTKNTQTANQVYAGPASGSAAAPTFRALVSADVPGSLSNPMTTQGDIIYGGASGAPTRLAAGTTGQVLQTNGSSAAPSWVAAGTDPNALFSTVGVVVDGGGSVPATGTKGFIAVPYAGTITGWSIIADQSGSASFDVWLIAGSAPPTAPTVPTSANKISASAPVALSSAQSAAGGSSAISTWTTAVTQWAVFGFNLTSVSTCTRITLELQVTRS